MQRITVPVPRGKYTGDTLEYTYLNNSYKCTIPLWWRPGKELIVEVPIEHEAPTEQTSKAPRVDDGGGTPGTDSEEIMKQLTDANEDLAKRNVDLSSEKIAVERDRDSWQERATQLEQQLAQLVQEKDASEAALEQQRTVSDSWHEQATRLEQQLTQLVQEKDASQEAFEQQRTVFEKQIASLAQENTQLKEALQPRLHEAIKTEQMKALQAAPSSSGVGLFWAEPHLSRELTHVVDDAAQQADASHLLRLGTNGQQYPVVILAAMLATDRVSVEVKQAMRDQCKAAATKTCVLIALRWTKKPLSEVPSGIDSVIPLYIAKDERRRPMLQKCPENTRALQTLNSIITSACPPPPSTGISEKLSGQWRRWFG